MQNEPLLQPRQIRLVILGAALLLIGLAVYYAATHGRLSLTNLDDKKITIARITKDGTEAPVTVGNGAFLSSGDYMVRNDTDGHARLAHISIPRWLLSKDMALQPELSVEVKKVASLTYEDFFRADDSSLVSASGLYGTTAGYTVHPDGDAFGANYTDVSFGNASLIGGSVTSRGSLIGVQGSSLQQYSFNTKSFSKILDLTSSGDGDENTYITHHSSNIYSPLSFLYQKEANKLDVIDASTGEKKEFSTPVVSTANTVIDANEKYYGIVDSQANSQAANKDDTEAAFTVDLISTSSGDKKALPIGSAKAVSAIAISPNGAYLAAIKDDKVWVYDVASKKVIMTNPYQSTNQILWSNDKLYTVATTDIAVFDPSHQQITPLKVPKSITISNVTAIGSVLYVSAFSDQQSSKLPDGYMIDLTKLGDDITEKLATKLPYDGDSYTISYLGSTIYIQASYLYEPENGPVTQKLRQEAKTKLDSLIDAATLARCKIVYVD